MHYSGNIFELLLTHVFEDEIEAARDIHLHPRRDADPAGLGQAFEPRRNIDAIPENVAILDDDISDIDANAELDPIVARNRRIALGHRRPHFDRAAQRVDDAGELDQQTVAHRLDDPAMMLGNLGIRHLGADCPEPFQGSALVDADQPQIAGDIGREDRREPTLNADRPRGLDGASSVSDDPILTRAGRALGMSVASVKAASILLLFEHSGVPFSLFRALELRCYFGHPFSIKLLKYLKSARFWAVIRRREIDFTLFLNKEGAPDGAPFVTRAAAQVSRLEKRTVVARAR
jgi:hypothetical protein